MAPLSMECQKFSLQNKLRNPQEFFSALKCFSNTFSFRLARCSIFMNESTNYGNCVGGFAAIKRVLIKKYFGSNSKGIKVFIIQHE